MATTLGGAALGEPAYEADGYQLEAVTIGALNEMASGAVVHDYVTTRYHFSLKWKAIIEAEKDVIRGKALVGPAQTFITPDGDTYTVVVVPNSWRESYVEGGDAVKYFNCELQLEEIA